MHILAAQRTPHAMNISHHFAQLAVVTLVLLALAGCDVFGGGDDYSDLQPGTFRFTADGRTYEGAALYDPSEDLQFDQAAVFLTSSQMQVMQISSDAFLTASVGDRIEPLVLASVGGAYQGRSGDVEILSTDGGGLEGRFRFTLKKSGSGPIQGRDITAEGAFRAVLAEE